MAVPAAGTLKTYRQVPWDQENSQSSCRHCGESLQGPGRLDSLPACAKPQHSVCRAALDRSNDVTLWWCLTRLGRLDLAIVLLQACWAMSAVLPLGLNRAAKSGYTAVASWSVKNNSVFASKGV